MNATGRAAASVGFVGLGNMGAALAAGLVRSGRLSPDALFGFDPSASVAPEFAGVRCQSLSEVAAKSELLVLAVKPHLIGGVCADLAQMDRRPAIVVSIAAGVPLDAIASALGDKMRVVRSMPNLAATLGFSATALYAKPSDAGALETAAWLFEAVGSVVTLARESDMHAFTAVAGSGPAFACLFAEALADAGVHEGLTRDTARVAAAAMLRGAAELLLVPGAVPGAVKDAVSSPGGTTIAGIAALEAGGFRGAVMSAVLATAQRSRSLAGGS